MIGFFYCLCMTSAWCYIWQMTFKAFSALLVFPWNLSSSFIWFHTGRSNSIQFLIFFLFLTKDIDKNSTDGLECILDLFFKCVNCGINLRTLKKIVFSKGFNVVINAILETKLNVEYLIKIFNTYHHTCNTIYLNAAY